MIKSIAVDPLKFGKIIKDDNDQWKLDREHIDSSYPVIQKIELTGMNSIISFSGKVTVTKSVYNYTTQEVELINEESSGTLVVVYNWQYDNPYGVTTYGTDKVELPFSESSPIDFKGRMDNKIVINSEYGGNLEYSVEYYIQCSGTGLIDNILDFYNENHELIAGKSLYSIPRAVTFDVREWGDYSLTELRTDQNSDLDVLDVNPSYPYPASLWYEDSSGSVTALLPEEITTPTLPYPAGLWREENSKVMLGFQPELTIGAFSNAKNLKQISIPKSVKKIGRFAFRNTKLTKVTIANDCTYCDTSFPEGCIVSFYPD